MVNGNNSVFYTNSQNYATTYLILCFWTYNTEHSTSSPPIQTGVHAHNKLHDISNNMTCGYSGDLRWPWLVIYMWLFIGCSKIKTAQELSVSPPLWERSDT